MTRHIIRRLLQAVPLLLIITALLFILTASLGDPLAAFGGDRRQLQPADRARLERQLGLDKPMVEQYAIWLVGNDWMKVDLDGDGIPDAYGTRRGVLRGDVGYSFRTRKPVLQEIGQRVPNTLYLMLTTLFVALAIAIPIGVLSALKQYSSFD